MTPASPETVKFDSNDEILHQFLDHAKFLLTQTDVSLEAIAARGGWENEATFAVVFEKTVGVTPVHYRNWHQCRQ